MRRMLTFLVMLCILTSVFQAALADTLPLITRSSAVDGTVRVRLDSIPAGTYTLTVNGSYSVNGDASRILGSKATVSYSGGSFTLTTGGVTTDMGKKFKLVRHGTEGGLRIAQASKPNNVYPGDLEFRVEGGAARAVLHVFLEDYLYGVLPYEMDNTFPIEALKAQAITARTYAAKAMIGNNAYYHVTDTTNSQVYRGTPSGNEACKRAVDATAGNVLMVGNTFCASYFTASNGGQTESNKNAWGGSAISYLPIKDDPYDLANPASSKKSHIIYTQKSLNTPALVSLLQRKLADKHGVGDFDSITLVEPHTPLFKEPSRVYSKMRFTLAANGGTYAVDVNTFGELESMLGLALNSPDTELYTVESDSRGFRIMARRLGHGVGLSQRGAQQMAQNGMTFDEILAFYFEGVSRVAYTFQRSDGTAQVPADLPISTSTPAGDGAGEVYTVSLSDPSSNLHLRNRANANADALASIPHGASVLVIGSEGDWVKARYGDETGYLAAKYLVKVNAGAATPTGAGQKAWVKMSDINERLNVREGPSTLDDVVLRVRHGDEVEILGTKNKWSHIAVGSEEGYVLSSYLTTVQAGTQASSQTNASAQATNESTTKAFVSLKDTESKLNLRETADADAKALAKLPHGAEVELLSENGAWCKVRSGGVTGYVLRAYLNTGSSVATASIPTPTSTEKAWINLKDEQSRANLRESASQNADIVDRIPHGSEVTLLEKGKTWSLIAFGGQAGHVATEYLAFAKPNVAQSSGMANTAEAVPASVGAYAWIDTGKGEGTVNLREERASDADVVVKLPHGVMVEILSTTESWFEVRYEGKLGFVASKYVKDQAPTQAAPVQTATQTQTTAQVETPTISQPSGYTGRTINRGTVRLESTGSSLNVRTAANEDADVAAKVRHGEAVDVLSYAGKNAAWVCISVGGDTGFVAREYVRLADAVGVISLKDANSTLSLREAPNSDADVVEKLANGTGVTVLDRGAEWCRVRVAGGREGYVASGYLKIK